MNILNGYIGKVITQLPHILPIIEKYEGTIYTDSIDVKTWMDNYSAVPCIISNPPPNSNLLLADYFYFPNNNTIQIFHGVSEKAYIKSIVPKWFTYIINPSPQYCSLDPYTALKGFSRYFLYRDIPTYTPSNTLTCLYCPTLIRENISSILEYINLLLNTYDTVLVKLHPFNSRLEDSFLISAISALGASVVLFTSEEYIRYEKLFKRVDVLASDISSIMYEFSLTGKKIITPNGDRIINPEEWFYPNDIFEVIEKCLK